MNTQINKKRVLIFVSVLVSIVIIIFFPYGNEILLKIRDHYRPVVYGKEVIYSNIESGDIRIADGILNNSYEVSRFSPVVIEKITWEENSYDDIYWRFNFYNLEPVRNLLFAWESTDKIEYKNKLIEITESFIDNGTKGPYSWDLHGTSFRVMTLINVREKLRAKNELSEELDKKILETLKVHGDFLSDPTHFEDDYNHGLDQSAALYLLAINYPDMPGASEWLKLSSKRIAEMQANIIDTDGVLVENSPYYHFYVLEKFLEINKYLKQNNLSIEGFSVEKINKMIAYAVYILQPDLSVPTIGASIGRQINLFDIYKEISITHPDLLYVLSQGNQGVMPANLNIQYQSSGQTIMRSGWEKGKKFANQTQLIFDVGEYRTNHSDFDALSFHLFGRGIVLLPDSGLYSYEESPYRTYFHGTRSHNTVVVDDGDQLTGLEPTSKLKNVYKGSFKEGDGYVYQSGAHKLYSGVSHKRAILMIEDSTIIIFDNLTSSSSHKYDQMFHLFPGAKVTTDGLTLTASTENPEQSLSIQQFLTSGIELKTSIDQNNPPDGLCSIQYKIAVPCHSVSYSQKGNNASFVTAISIGKKAPKVSLENDILKVTTKKKTYSINISETESVEESLEVKKNYDTSDIYSNSIYPTSLNDFVNWERIYLNQAPANDGYVRTEEKENSLELVTPTDGSHLDSVLNTNIDLSSHNIYFKYKINNSSNLVGFDFYVSNNSWEKYARINAKSFYPSDDRSQDGKWIRFGVAKGEFLNSNLGNWELSGDGFDWSKVDAIKIALTSNVGKSITVNVKDFYLIPAQKNPPRVVIVFDDGWSSVIDAADIMKKYGFKGNVGVISNAVGMKNYMTLEEIKALQNEYGWNIVNHSDLHKDAINTYVKHNDLYQLDQDISKSLRYLVENKINSAPNWYIYPDGRTDESVMSVVGKYYKFARSTVGAPALFPFADPLKVPAISVYTGRATATPLDIHNAIKDAKKYRQTIFLMFHKITDGTPSHQTEYSRKDFEQIMNDINDQGIGVVTLSELDKENAIPESDVILTNESPSQYELDISTSQNISIINIWRWVVSLNFL